MKQHQIDMLIGDLYRNDDRIPDQVIVDAHAKHADHPSLIRAFYELNESFNLSDLPEPNDGIRGSAYLADGQHVRSDTASGECGRCGECGHPTVGHCDDDGGGPVTESTVFTYCGVGNCNCGNNTRR